MVSFTVRMQFAEGDREAVEAMLRHLAEGSRQEPGCVNYIAHFVVGEPATVLIYEQYVDEAAVDHHRNTAHFREHAVGGLYRQMLGRLKEDLEAVL